MISRCRISVSRWGRKNWRWRFRKAGLADHPLTRADMEQEQEFFEGGGFELIIT